jgi:hypothetical protein
MQQITARASSGNLLDSRVVTRVVLDCKRDYLPSAVPSIRTAQRLAAVADRENRDRAQSEHFAPVN